MRILAALAYGFLATSCSAASPTPSTQALAISTRPAEYGNAPSGFKDLYVSDLGAKFGQGGVFMLEPPSYKVVGKLTAGMDAPVGLWVDRSGNLYVANANGHDATEYALGKKHPTCTYEGTVDPTNVKTNKQGDVFVMDWNNGEDGTIDVYKQCKSAIVRTYTFGGGSRRGSPSDVAFGNGGAMFVLYLKYKHGQQVGGALEEFAAHSKTPTHLGASVTFPGGLLIDQHQNLIVADQGVQGANNGAIDIVAPPYKLATTLVSDLDQPVWLSLNRSETLLFASSYDHQRPTIWIFDYPSGKLEATLGAANGLHVPLGVAAAPDFTR